MKTLLLISGLIILSFIWGVGLTYQVVHFINTAKITAVEGVE